MKKLLMRAPAFILGVCALVLLNVTPLGTISSVKAQGDATITAEVDRTTVSTDDLLTLTLTVSGDFQQLGEPQLPLFSGFNVVGNSRSSQFSMVNGVVTARTVFNYQLQPADAGTFTIDPITILVNGTSYQTDRITVQVTQGDTPTQSPDSEDTEPPIPSSPDELTGQDFYIDADVDNRSPYVGQQIIYHFRFYQAVNLFNQPRLDWPSFGGFWAEALAPNNVYEQTTAGRRYRVTDVRQALFPTAPGRVIIQPATLTIPGDLFSPDIVLESKAVEVKVQSLPADAPNDFTGVVGAFEISARVEQAEARVNEPVTLFVRLWGTGNPTTLPDPTADAEAALSEWRVYDPQITTNVRQNGETIQGEKLFERLLVPKTDGPLSIPSFSMVIFDPAAEVFRRIETEPIVIDIQPGEQTAAGSSNGTNGKQDITVLASDIRHIKAAPPSLQRQRTTYLEHPSYWLAWLLPPLAVVVAWTWERHHRRLSSDTAYARAQRANRLARKRLSMARGFTRTDEDAAYAAVDRALNDYLGDKFNLPSAGLTRDAVRTELTLQSVPQELVSRTLACLDWADSGRFAPVAAGRGTDELVADAENILAELEQTLRIP